jgi:hypothetical protein
VVLDAGAAPEIAAERFARLAPKAVLVAALDDPAATRTARERLMAAGFADITVLSGIPQPRPEAAKVAPAPVAS